MKRLLSFGLLAIATANLSFAAYTQASVSPDTNIISDATRAQRYPLYRIRRLQLPSPNLHTAGSAPIAAA